VGVTSTYLLPQRTTKKYVSIYLNDDTLKPEVKIGTPGHAVLNKIQWFILATIKSNIPKNEKHELDDNQHTLSVYCGRYIRITSEKTQMYLSKQHWTQIMDLASVCIDREVIKYGRLQDELVEWRNKCFDSKSFCTHPDTNAIDFDTLSNELKYKNTSLSDDN
jgi:hypothetical protein